MLNSQNFNKMDDIFDTADTFYAPTRPTAFVTTHMLFLDISMRIRDLMHNTILYYASSPAKCPYKILGL